MSTPIRVLYVDDNSLDRELVRDALEREHGGFAVTEAASRAEFETRLAAGAYDVVLSDFNILGFDGLAVLDAVRGVDPTVPVVIVTGTGSEEVAAEAIKRGAADYVIKTPRHIHRLPQTIHAALDKVQPAAGRVRAEEALRESEQKFRSLVEQSSDGIVIVDEQGVVVEWNQGQEQMSGLTRAEALGRRMWDLQYQMLPDELKTPAMQARFQKSIQSLLDTGQFPQLHRRMETTIQLPDGTRRNVQLVLYQFRTDKGFMAGSITRDITERKRAEEALARERNLLRTLIDNLPDYIYVKDAEGRFMLGNLALARSFGKSTSDEIQGKTDFDFHPSELARQYDTDEQELLRSGQPLINREELVIEATGERRWVLTTKVPLHDRSARVMGLVGIGHDITERKLMEDRLRATLTDLERSNADLQQFAYVASHDLQEPLRMVASYVQLLGMNYRGRLDADADEFIGYALEGATRMQQLLLDLLEYSRVGTRSAPLQPIAATLACQTALQDLEIAIAENHATVVCDPLPTVLADPSQLIQLFQNLIANAIKFHGAEPPHVHISARQTFEVSELAKVSLNARQTFEVSELAKVSLNARQTFEVSETSKVAAKVWEFAVRDNGIGIEPAYFERIFVIFQRLHTRDAYAGTGIGLAVCKRIVERHGGRIWIESTPGQGSTFYFTLPAAT